MRRTFASLMVAISAALIVFFSLAFAFIKAPALSGTPLRPATALPHPIAGFEDCVSCHGIEEEESYPESHLGWPNESCLQCHPPSGAEEPVAPTAAAGEAPRGTPLATEGPPAATPTANPGTSPAPASGPVIPHPIAGYEDCLGCHARDAEVPFPPDHVGRANDSCSVCHSEAD